MLFERQIGAIKQQLAALNASQRVAIGLCAAIVAGSLLWLTQWSLQHERVPLYSEALTDQQLRDIAGQLTLRGEDFEEREQSIWVRPDQRRRIMMSLVERRTGPKSLSFTFKEMIGQDNVFAPESTRQRQYTIALQNELAMTIRTMEMVRDASVHIAADHEPLRLGQPRSRPKATVTVEMMGRERLPKEVVETLAGLVSGAVPRLEPQDVTVVDVVGRSYRLGNPEDELASELYDLQRQKEGELRGKIEDMLAHIPGVIATVSLKLDPQASQTVERKLGEPVVKREYREESTMAHAHAAAEPGVEANVGAALVGASGGENSISERIETEYQVERDNTVTTTSRQPGEVLEAAASVQIPRSYVVAAVRARSTAPDVQPEEDDIDDEAAELVRRIQDMVAPILVARAKPQVEVGIYFDDAASRAAAVAPPPAAAGLRLALPELMSAYGKQAGLVALAVIALVAVLQISRRSGAAALPDAETSAGSRSMPLGELVVDGGPIGEAGSPDAFLIARETDESSIRARQMAQQVTDLINDDPESAAQLVRRWIGRER
jgi:flagellar M-ring protein FliF